MMRRTRSIGSGGNDDITMDTSPAKSAYIPPDNIVDDVKMWPSERVAQGGLFHAPKVEYSKETADLLKLLMEESRMSMSMRKQIDSHVKNGEPLPKPEPPRINTSGDPDANAAEILRRARNAKRKSLSRIVASGAYEPTPYRPAVDNRRYPIEKDKQRLQEAMSGLRLANFNLKAKRRPHVTADDQSTPEQTINELFDQINERADWLSAMEELGEGKKYRDEIREQISERLRQIKALETKIAIQKQGLRLIE